MRSGDDPGGRPQSHPRAAAARTGRRSTSTGRWEHRPQFSKTKVKSQRKESNTVVPGGAWCGALQRPPPAVYQLQEYAFNSPNIPNLDVTYGFIL